MRGLAQCRSTIHQNYSVVHGIRAERYFRMKRLAMAIVHNSTGANLQTGCVPTNFTQVISAIYFLGSRLTTSGPRTIVCASLISFSHLSRSYPSAGDILNFCTIDAARHLSCINARFRPGHAWGPTEKGANTALLCISCSLGMVMGPEEEEEEGRV